MPCAELARPAGRSGRSPRRARRATIAPATALRPALASRRRRASSPTSVRTAPHSVSGASGLHSSPVAPCRTRSSGPPAAGAITATPAAMASWRAWQNVSSRPVCTKMSSDATSRLSSLPRRNPTKTASGSRRSSHRRRGPSPTTTTRTPLIRVIGWSRSTCFSRASRPQDPDDDLTMRCERLAQGLVAELRVELATVDAAPPQLDRPDPVLAELPRRHRRWSERERGRCVGSTHHRPHRLLGHAEVVAPREVGVVRSDHRHTEIASGPTRTAAEHERGCEVDDVRCEPGDDRRDPVVGERNPARPVEGQGDRPRAQHLRPGRSLAARLRRDDECRVVALLEVTGQPGNGRRHAVQLRQERLGDDRHAHGFDRTSGR